MTPGRGKDFWPRGGPQKKKSRGGEASRGGKHNNKEGHGERSSIGKSVNRGGSADSKGKAAKEYLRHVGKKHPFA